ncbi:transcriptional regulator [Planctomycetota bacterium]|nr:transcriptional regulator [Planctomycetota bacterium]
MPALRDEPNNLLTLPSTPAVSLSIRASAVVFADPRSRALRDLIVQVAPSDANILIIGETGTGKEIVARQIHATSRRAKGPFAAVNCGAFTENLIESELFGHEQGSFTGAVGARPGWFETAHGGTLFLDEIGDLPLPMQVKLLRVLQEREVVRVGSRTPIPVDVRLVAATNVDLQQAVQAGRFRADLYYRLRVVTVALPALRERPGDILPLAEHFIDVYGRRLQVDRALGEDARQALLEYAWPGNIRELENLIHRALLVSSGDEIRADDLNLHQIALPEPAPIPDDLAPVPDDHLREVLDELLARNRSDLFDTVMSELVRAAYAHSEGNQVQAAEALSLSRNTYRTLLKRYGLLSGTGRSSRVDREARAQLLRDERAS